MGWGQYKMLSSRPPYGVTYEFINTIEEEIKQQNENLSILKKRKAAMDSIPKTKKQRTA